VSVASTVFTSIAWFATATTSPKASLDRAHEAYLARDFVTMTSSARDVLADPACDAVMRANAFELLKAANADSGGNLPVDWKVPAGVSNLRISQVRREQPEGTTYKLRIRGDMDGELTVVEVRLVRHPDEVVLDKHAAHGEWETGNDGGSWYFSLETAPGGPIDEDLYRLSIRLRDGTVMEGWLILSDLEASSAPEVVTPKNGDVLPSRPAVEWKDFRTLAYRPYETSQTNVSFTRVEPDNKGWETTWGLYVPARTDTRTVVGEDPQGEGAKQLEPGRYWFSLEYNEQRWFGPVKLRRAARTSFPVSVEASP
jgi:hypothetical protein